MAEELLLDVRHLTHVFPLGRHASVKAVDDLSFQIRRGEIFGLVGESGSGKSTVARCVMSLYRPTAGEILFKGVNLCDRADCRAHRTMLQRERQLIFQDSTSSLNQRLKVWDIIAEPMRIHNIRPPRGTYRAEAEFQMHYVGLDAGYLDKYPPELSGGQRRWTCPFRPKLSICFVICSGSTAFPSCLSPMIWPWWSFSVTGWGSCTTAEWWNPRPQARCSSGHCIPIPRHCCRPSPFRILG